MEKKRIAVIRIHGKSGLKKGAKDTLVMLRLYKKHNCVIVSNTKEYVGMIAKVKEYTTWGEINEETLISILKKRGRLARKKHLTEEYAKQNINMSIEEYAKEVFSFKKELNNLPGIKLFFKLSPPKGGFERAGIKTQFAEGGALGYRKDRINELIARMI